MLKRNNNSWAAVVDPYSTGVALPALLKENGFRVVHIQCGHDDSLHPLDWKDIENCSDAIDRKLILEQNFDAIADELRQLGVKLVLPGYEGVVDIAETLAAKLGCPSNVFEKVAARTNKQAMYTQAAAAGLKIAKFASFSDFKEAQGWIEREHLSFPLIVKPLNSAGMEGVSLCHDLTNVRSAFAQLLGTTNILKRANNKLMLQQFISGREYVVNGLSISGKTTPTDFWVYKKRQVDQVHFIYETISLCSQANLPPGLLDYHQHALTCLGFEWGPSHGEFYHTPEGEIVLGEVGARAPGAHLPEALLSATGFDFMRTSVLAYTAPEATSKALEEHTRQLEYGTLPMRHCRVVLLISEQTGTIKQIHHSLFSAIPSLKKLEINYEEGDFLTKTQDLVTSPGLCVLVAPSAAELDRDEEQIRFLERNLFELENA